MRSDAYTVSIVIPTLNAAAYLPELARSFETQTLIPIEVLVIDSESTDSTTQVADSLGWLTASIPRSEFDHGNTRNMGARLTTGGVIVFITQDAMPANSDWLRELTLPLEDDTIGATFSRQVARDDASLREKYARLGNYPSTPTVYSLEDVDRVGVRAMFLSNVSSATRRTTFEAVGGFASRAILNEDGYYAAALLERGLSVAYVPASEVLHSHDYGATMQFRRYFDIGVSHTDGPPLMRGAATTGAGLKFAVGQIRYLVQEQAFGEVLFSVIETGAKALGYNLGKRYSALPMTWRRALGWNKRYWNSQE